LLLPIHLGWTIPPFRPAETKLPAWILKPHSWQFPAWEFRYRPGFWLVDLPRDPVCNPGVLTGAFLLKGLGFLPIYGS
jgi:hypothetical protein